VPVLLLNWDASAAVVAMEERQPLLFVRRVVGDKISLLAALREQAGLDSRDSAMCGH